MSGRTLPPILNCDNCGACCMMTPVPPFEPGEAAEKDVPEELLREAIQIKAEGREFEVRPCIWFDTDSRQCRHYELRPDNCRKFEQGSDLCRLSRWDMGID